MTPSHHARVRSPWWHLLPILVTGVLARAADSVVILQYHHFGDDTPPSTSVSREQFEQHVGYLAAHDVHVLPLQEALESLRAGTPLPADCVAITIDDAYVSVYERAYPLLREHGWPFTVFVTSEGIDRGSASYMTWDQMRAMAESGAVFANHSHTHSYLVRHREGEDAAAWRARVTQDIQRCQDRLRAELGEAPPLFAYPYGEYSVPLMEIVSKLGMIGLGQHSGPAWSGSDFRALPRFPMAADFADLESFVVKVRSLPLPVLTATPAEPVLPPDNLQPCLRLRLGPGDYRIEDLACYVSGQGRAEVRWIDRTQRILEVAAAAPLPPGRSRYNFTAPLQDGTRFCWYSHPWIRNP